MTASCLVGVFLFVLLTASVLSRAALGVVPTTYGYSGAPGGGSAAPVDGGAGGGGDGLSRWFAHLSTANLPAVPAQATQYNVMQQQQQQQQQQRPPHQQQQQRY